MQDTIIELVKGGVTDYKAAFGSQSTGLTHLLTKWGIPDFVAPSVRGSEGVVAVYDEEANES